MVYARGKPGWTFRLGHLLLGIAVIAGPTAILMRGLAVRRFERGARASERVFRPIITYHDQVAANYRREARESYELAVQRSGGVEVRDFYALAAARLGLLVISRPTSPGDAREWITAVSSVIRSICRDVWSLARRERGSASVLDNFRSLVWSSRMAAHHARLGEYYSRLLAERRSEMPALPATLRSERSALEAELRLKNGNPALMLLPAPPPDLMPGTPRSRHIAPNQGGFDNGYSTSF